MLRARPFKAVKDYLVVAGFWDAHGWPIVPLRSLPGTGYVVEVDSKPIAAGWVYKSDSNICKLEFIVADPKAEKQVRSEALDHLIKLACEDAKKSGFEFVWSSTAHPALISRFKKHEFLETDVGVTNVMKRL
jgi:hypothetical protein